MPVRKSRQTTYHLFKGIPYANLCPLLPSPSIRRPIVKSLWLLNQTLHTYQLDRSTRTACVVFLKGSLVLFIYLQGCEPLEFKILMFTTGQGSNLLLFKQGELMLKWTYDSRFWQSKTVNKITEVGNTAYTVSKPWTKGDGSSTIYKVPFHQCFSEQLLTASLKQYSLC